MKRVNDWATKLAQLLHERRDMPFKWGEHDCCLFAADAYRAMCDIDLASDFRGRYKTELGAYRALKRLGYADVDAVLTAKLGEPKATAIYERGDILLMDIDGRQTAGVYFNGAWGTSEHSLVQVPRNKILKAWSVK